VRLLLLLHRWLGVALCLLFLLWFPSGIAMMYWGYPEVTEADRLAHGIDLDTASIRIAPTDVFATVGRSGPVLDLRLNSYNGRPVYRLTDSDGESVYYADSGDAIEDVPQPDPLDVAAAWAGRPASRAARRQVAQVDQWTLQIPFADLQPIWKYAWPEGDEVYVSALTGEVVQHTTRGSRWRAYAGPITHWLYFTPLRSHGRAWSRVVMWASGLGLVAAVAGLALGSLVYLPRRRNPYFGQKRWHLYLGLIVGIAAMTWVFSGWLSMDPVDAISGASARRAAAAGAVPRALRARPSMDAFFGKTPQEALAELRGQHVRELVMTTLGDEPYYLATLADGRTRVVPVQGPPQDDVDRSRLDAVIRRAAAATGGATISLLSRYDAYYLDRRGGLPLPVLLVQLNDAARTRYYVDPRTAQVVGGYSAGRWINRWLYHGLHSLDFPWLYATRPLWDIVVVTAMLAGTALTFTSVVLAFRAVARSLRF
jgi:hypothetical protein